MSEDLLQTNVEAEVIESRDESGYDLIVTSAPGSIESNIAGLKAWIAKVVEPYQGRAVPIDQYKFAKKDLADLRKLQKTLEDERKRAKTIIMAPYEEFEKLYKEAKAPLDDAIAGINRQVKEIEEEEKTLRKNNLVSFIQSEAKALSGESLLIKMEKPEVLEWFVDPKWLLSSATTTSVQLAVREKLIQVQRDYDCILKDAPDAAAIDAYNRTGSLSAAFEAKRKADAIKAEIARKDTPAAPAPEPAPVKQPVATPTAETTPPDGYTSTPGFILIQEAKKPTDEALLQTIRIPLVLEFPKYKMPMIKQIMTKCGIKILRDKPSSEVKEKK